MTAEDTHHRRKAVEAIHDIVSAMRAIAAGRIQGAQRTLAAARRYEETVLRGLAALPIEALHLPDRTPDAPTMLLVMMSEQPLCGAFNQDLLPTVERGWRSLRQVGPVDVLLIGQRGSGLVSSLGIEPVGIVPAATSLNGLRDLVKQVASLLSQRFASGSLGAVRVIYNRYQSVTEQIATEEQILPLDLSRLEKSDLPRADRSCYRYLTDAALFAGMVSEMAFITLYRLAADSFASEQAARLVAMDGATRNTERLAKDLTNLERRERQGEVTRQVLELITARCATSSNMSGR